MVPGAEKRHPIVRVVAWLILGDRPIGQKYTRRLSSSVLPTGPGAVNPVARTMLSNILRPDEGWQPWAADARSTHSKLQVAE